MIFEGALNERLTKQKNNRKRQSYLHRKQRDCRFLHLYYFLKFYIFPLCFSLACAIIYIISNIINEREET